MMALNPPPPPEKESSHLLSKPIPLRRHRSKGTTVGYADSNPNGVEMERHSIPHISNGGSGARPCQSARLALICINGAIGMGNKTKMALTPKCRTEDVDEEEEEELTSGDEEIHEETQGGIRVASSITERVEGVVGDSNGKLAFGQRKIRFFDCVTAQDREAARQFLRGEMMAAKKRERDALNKHLRREQQKERRRRVRRQERKKMRMDIEESAEEESDDSEDEGNGSSTNSSPRPEIQTKLPHGMSLSLSAALVLESLLLTPLESVEGLAKCYDGLVAAGTALLNEEDKSLVNSSPSSSPIDDGPGRAKILDSLRFLLITTLDHLSGDAILALAHLRSMCGVARYRRRFVQRIAPVLVRPPNAAIWCLRHQNDMAAIVAATELLLDAANDIFSHGWHERGRLLLADGRRVELLNVAAKQLKSLASGGANSAGHRKTGSITMKGSLAPSKEGDQTLAEWEVLAVDRHIRKSIENLFTKDWSKVLHGPFSSLSGANPSQSRNVGQLRANTAGNGCPMSPRASLKIPLSPHHSNQSMQQPPQPPPPEQPALIVSTTAATTPPTPVISPCKSPTPGQQPLYFSEPFKNEIKPAPLIAPLTPKQQHPSVSIPSSSVVGTPPRSPSSPPRNNVSKSNFLISSAPQIPIIQTSAATSTPAPLSPSPSTTSQSSTSSKPYYRMLTGSAAERKRTVAACRALRAQITRFEEAFIQLHGRPPKGAAERAPLATTYAQYREWKRAIRADAACRIQALVRGARCRWILLRSNNPELAMIVQRNNRSRSVLRQLSIPVEIGEQEEKVEVNKNEGVEVVISPTERGKAVSLSPSWQTRGDKRGRRQLEQRKENSDRKEDKITVKQHSDNGVANIPVPTRRQSVEQPFDPFDVNSTPQPHRFSHSSSHSITSARSSTSNTTSFSLEGLPIADLLAKKRELKNRLKQYDMDFAREQGRMPVKSEKEPIRHLYEQYNALKSQINLMERGGGGGGGGGGGSGTTHMRSSSISSGGTDSSGEDSGLESTPVLTTTRRKDRSKLSSHVQASHSVSSSDSSTITPSGAPSGDLAALKAEKGQLHLMLRNYEKDFYRDHRRQVSSFADIRPVASQYRRYKEIKKAIAALQAES